MEKEYDIATMVDAIGELLKAHQTIRHGGDVVFSVKHDASAFAGIMVFDNTPPRLLVRNPLSGTIAFDEKATAKFKLHVLEDALVQLRDKIAKRVDEELETALAIGADIDVGAAEDPEKDARPEWLTAIIRKVNAPAEAKDPDVSGPAAPRPAATGVDMVGLQWMTPDGGYVQLTPLHNHTAQLTIMTPTNHNGIRNQMSFNFGRKEAEQIRQWLERGYVTAEFK